MISQYLPQRLSLEEKTSREFLNRFTQTVNRSMGTATCFKRHKLGSSFFFEAEALKQRFPLSEFLPVPWGVINEVTPPKFNSSPLKNDGWKTSFLLRRSIFRGELLNFGRVSGGFWDECEIRIHQHHPSVDGRNWRLRYDEHRWYCWWQPEIPRPTTFWMVLKPWKEWWISTTNLNWLVFRPDFWLNHQQYCMFSVPISSFSAKIAPGVFFPFLMTWIRLVPKKHAPKPPPSVVSPPCFLAGNCHRVEAWIFSVREGCCFVWP